MMDLYDAPLEAGYYWVVNDYKDWEVAFYSPLDCMFLGMDGKRHDRRDYANVIPVRIVRPDERDPNEPPGVVGDLHGTMFAPPPPVKNIFWRQKFVTKILNWLMVAALIGFIVDFLYRHLK